MLIKKRQTAFIRDGQDSASYWLLRNKVQWEIRSAKYDYYHHKVSDLEQTDSNKFWKQIKLLTGQEKNRNGIINSKAKTVQILSPQLIW